MFEMTFTGRWGIYARTVQEHISIGFAIFFVPYVVVVNFAVMRVVAALFLKQTLSVAAQDDAKKAAKLEAEKERIAGELSEFFGEADVSGNGAVSSAEFEAMLKNPSVAEHFKDLGLETEEAVALFGVLCADDGEADYQEFLDGALKMRKNAQVSDIIQMMHTQGEVLRAIDEVHKIVCARPQPTPSS